jgi:microcystin-dependent protein
MEDAYIGEIRMFSFDWAPKGWLLCQGQTLQIAQFQPLYALIGNNYGGDGTRTFQLPNLTPMPVAGGGANEKPGPAMNFAICINGMFPSRD